MCRCLYKKVTEAAAWFVEVDDCHNDVVYGGNDDLIHEWEMTQGKAWSDLVDALTRSKLWEEHAISY